MLKCRYCSWTSAAAFKRLRHEICTGKYTIAWISILSWGAAHFPPGKHRNNGERRNSFTLSRAAFVNTSMSRMAHSVRSHSPLITLQKGQITGALWIYTFQSGPDLTERSDAQSRRCNLCAAPANCFTWGPAFHFLVYNTSGKRDPSPLSLPADISRYSTSPEYKSCAWCRAHGRFVISSRDGTIPSLHLLHYYSVKRYNAAAVAALIARPLGNVAAVASATALSHNSGLLYSWTLFACWANTGFTL